MGQGILLSADQEVDFMVHGVFSYKWFGQQQHMYVSSLYF